MLLIRSMAAGSIQAAPRAGGLTAANILGQPDDKGVILVEQPGIIR
jgi:hypothetical protein